MRSSLTAVAVCGLLVLLTWPLITDGSRLLGDATYDAWLIAQQADALRQNHLPSHFVNFSTGIFYPVFAFYGGTMFVFAGAISLVVGSPMAAQAIVYILALAAAYGGWFWLARLAGLGFWPAQAPALLYVTAPYVVTNVNARQDLVETVATSMIPLLLASALSILRADRLRAGPFAALAISTILASGSHNLTLLWATTIFAPAALAMGACVPQTRRLVTRSSLLRVLAVMVPAVAVNAWYLSPDLAYYTHTVIAQRIDEWSATVSSPSPAIDATHLFSLGRPSALTDPSFAAALPVLAIAWIIAAAIVARKHWRRPWARTLTVLSLLTIAVTIVMTHPRLINALPDPWEMIQYSYRLETFILFGICGALIAALALLGSDTHRWLTWLLIPILALSTLGAVRQAGDAPRFKSDLPWTIDNFRAFSIGDYAEASLKPRPQDDPVTSVVTLNRSNIRHDRYVGTVRAQPREIVYLDLMAISPLIDVQGARVIGRWAAKPSNPGWQPYWFLALRINDDATPGKAHITIREAQTLPIVGGRIVSLLGLLGLAANAAVIVRGYRRRRRRRQPAAVAV